LSLSKKEKPSAVGWAMIVSTTFFWLITAIHHVSFPEGIQRRQRSILMSLLGAVKVLIPMVFFLREGSALSDYLARSGSLSRLVGRLWESRS
jgi:hypothetical protein